MDRIPNSISLEEIIGQNKKYVVPFFQRGYSWEKEHVEELWYDINDIKHEYFMGAIVIDNEDKKEPKIVDGQQRIATFTIMLCIIRDLYYELNEADKANTLHVYYIEKKEKDPFFKLELSDFDKNTFQKYVQHKPSSEQRKDYEKFKTDSKKMNKTSKGIFNAYKYLKEKIELKIKDKNKKEKIYYLDQLEEKIKNKIIFMKIEVNNPAQAFTVFETLNDRGLELSVADLLKNHLFKIAYRRDMLKDDKKKKDLLRKWDEVLENLKNTDVVNFLRHYWMSKVKAVSKDKLFDEFRRHLKGINVVSFLDELIEYSDYYASFINPNVVDNEDIKVGLNAIKSLKASLCYALLLSGRKVLKKENDFIKLVRLAEIITFRYSTICSKDAKILEGLYSDLAIKLYSDKGKNLDVVIDELKEVVPSDDEFSLSFNNGEMSNLKKQTAYMLRKIEDHFSGGQEKVLAPKKVNIEHIIPITLTEEWLEYLNTEVTEIEQYINKFGNLTLLGSEYNKQASNFSYDKKVNDYYSKSKIKLTKKLIKKYKIWSLSNVEKRQEELCKIALKVWDPNK